MNLKTPNTVMAIGAVAVGLIVALMDLVEGSPRPPRWAQVVEEEGDHILPSELAEQLLAHPSDVVVVDVRPAHEFATWHLVGSVNLSVPRLLGGVSGF